MLATQLKYDLLMFLKGNLLYGVHDHRSTGHIFVYGATIRRRYVCRQSNYAETYTPSFILLITFGVVFFAFGFDQVMNRTTGVEKRISLSPVPKRTLLLSNILKSIIITSIGLFPSVLHRNNCL